MDKDERLKEARKKAVERYMRDRFFGLDKCLRKNYGLREADYQPSYGKLK